MSARVVNLRDFRDPANPRRFLLPPDVVRIDRLTRWGNPYKIDAPLVVWDDEGYLNTSDATREETIRAYRAWLANDCKHDFLEPLRGKQLACWCAPLACHGDVIAELIP